MPKVIQLGESIPSGLTSIQYKNLLMKQYGATKASGGSNTIMVKISTGRIKKLSRDLKSAGWASAPTPFFTKGSEPHPGDVRYTKNGSQIDIAPDGFVRMPRAQEKGFVRGLTQSD